MRRGLVHAVIVGADRIAANGDVANKIGTYNLAVLAKENGIPFYVAAPTGTLDMSLSVGEEIVIEERGEDEVLGYGGRARRAGGDGRVQPRVRRNPEQVCHRDSYRDGRGASALPTQPRSDNGRERQNSLSLDGIRRVGI